MPSETSYWLLSVPLEDHDAHAMYSSLASALSIPAAASHGSAGTDTPFDSSVPVSNLGVISLPPFKTGTLQSLISLADDLPKHDAAFTSIVSKIVDTLRNLLNDDREALSQHVRVNEQSLDQYVVGNWGWNASKYRVGERSLVDVVDSLAKEVNSIDNVMKQKLQNYNLAKSQLQALQRKKTGNLSTRSLADVVHRSDFADPTSEFLETLLVAVPKNSAKQWLSTYERLAPFVVPRSSRQLAKDEEYALFNVTLFKRHREEFLQKCRENKYTVRDFEWQDELVEKQREELESAGSAEKELWTELLRLSKTNFSEAYQALMHLKVVRAFVESVLRYGLPADYFAVAIRPNPKRIKQLVNALNSTYAHLGRKKKGEDSSGGGAQQDTPGEYAQLLEEEWRPYVLEEQYLPQL